ncbi:hypothetical protein EauS123_00025 [Exiguobacterium phage vB_EauS-123]|nr:hypothetical protein EauS123_00025 [Exiguobacterium phage vB_EauS-123]
MYTVQMWRLMQVFGEHIGLTKENPFVLSIALHNVDCRNESFDQDERIKELERENEELRRWVLWSARRLHRTYKDYVYDGYRDLTGEEPERL